MKKVLTLALAVLMLLSALCCFAGCTGGEENKNNNNNNNNQTDGSNVENDGENKGENNKTEKKVLKMATNAYFAPYEFYEGDKIVGIDAEIAAAVAAKLGMELVIEDMAFDSILTAVQNGSVDFGMAGMTVTEKRLQEVNFTTSYAKGVQSIIVKEGSAITSVDDLYADGATYKVGVQLGTTGDIYATDDFGEDRVTQYTTGNEAVSALLKGDVDCVIIDNQPAKSYTANNKGTKILDTSYADEDYAICVSKENKDLLEKLNKAIDELIADGTIEKIVNKYIKD